MYGQSDIDTLLNQLRRAPSLVLPLIREIPKQRLKARPAYGKWSAHVHACHLAVVHDMLGERLTRMIEEAPHRIGGYDPDAESGQPSLMDMDLDRALVRYEEGRTELVHRLESLTLEQWHIEATHDEYSHYSVYIMFRHLALHDFLHAYRIEEILLASRLP